MNTKIKFIKVTDKDLAERLLSEGALCYSQNESAKEWYFKNVPNIKFSDSEKLNIRYTNILNI